MPRRRTPFRSPGGRVDGAACGNSRAGCGKSHNAARPGRGGAKVEERRTKGEPDRDARAHRWDGPAPRPAERFTRWLRPAALILAARPPSVWSPPGRVGPASRRHSRRVDSRWRGRHALAPAQRPPRRVFRLPQKTSTLYVSGYGRRRDPGRYQRKPRGVCERGSRRFKGRIVPQPRANSMECLRQARHERVVADHGLHRRFLGGIRPSSHSVRPRPASAVRGEPHDRAARSWTYSPENSAILRMASTGSPEAIAPSRNT